MIGQGWVPCGWPPVTPVRQPKPSDITQVTLALLHCDLLKFLPSPSALDDGSRYGTGENIGAGASGGGVQLGNES